MYEDRLLPFFKIYKERLRSDLSIVPSNTDFWQLIGEAFPSEPILLEDAFPEFVGMEALVQALFNHNKNKAVRIDNVNRGGRFFSVQILPVFRDNSPDNFDKAEDVVEETIIALQDVSDDMEKHQLVVQQRNEISLMEKKLTQKNSELAELNNRLDALMHEIRTNSHKLDIQVLHRTQELNNTRLHFITTLARAAEFRELETGGHIYRIGRSSVLIGKAMGLSPGECSNLFYACLLHDVGKIGIPDSILLKEGPLNDSEWKQMKRHTVIGADLLSRNTNELILTARDVALYHHEFWDGNGYPEGRSKKDIPLNARICAVADVYDALVSERVYKKAWPIESAIKEIKQESGSHFDPEVVQAFLSVQEDIIFLSQKSDEEYEMLEPEFY